MQRKIPFLWQRAVKKCKNAATCAPHVTRYRCLYLLLCGAMLLASCRYSGEWRTANAVTYDGRQHFGLSFPDYLSEEKEHKLNKTAPVQYCNYFRNFYAIADDTLTESNYRQIAAGETARLFALLNEVQQTDTQSLVINGLPAFMAGMAGNVGNKDLNERIYYRLVFIQGTARVYRLTMWVWDKNREKYVADMDKIAGSFKEIH